MSTRARKAKCSAHHVNTCEKGKMQAGAHHANTCEKGKVQAGAHHVETKTDLTYIGTCVQYKM